MPIDMNQMLNMFVEETLELLQSMEAALLEIEIDNPDLEQINLIFRVMHSTKSGCAILGFNNLSDFCHTMETLLQKIRDGDHKLTQVDINLFFSSIDLLRTAIKDIKNKRPIDDVSINELLRKVFESLYEENHAPKNALESKISLQSKKQKTAIEAEPVQRNTPPFPPTNLPADEKISTKGWKIEFRPNQNLFELRNTPYRVFQHLKSLGKCDIKVNTRKLPDLEKIDPAKCYLRWDIELQTQSTLQEIKDTFSWITEDHTVHIAPIKSNKKEIRGDGELPTKFPPIPTTLNPQTISSPAPLPMATSIRVATEKIDYLMNVIGELVITQSMLSDMIEGFNQDTTTELYDGISHLERNLRDVQEIAMRMRMVPVNFIFNRFPRTIHDLSIKMKKQVNLIISGENTEIDKLLMEKIADPLLHLIRNAIDHGIELPYIREKSGKSPIGTISLNAYQEGGEIVIDVIDDGIGLNKEKIKKTAIAQGLISDSSELTDKQLYSLIFKAGFSTAEKITDVSGRGVGLDVVHRNIIESGGSIELQSTPNEGSIFRLRLPLTLAIMDSQLIRIQEQIYVVPLISIVELLKIEPQKIHRLDHTMTFYQLREDQIPLIFLAEVLDMKSHKKNKEVDEPPLPSLKPHNIRKSKNSLIHFQFEPNEFQGIKDDLRSKDINQFLIVVEINNNLYGLVCDELLAQKQIVIKSIEDNYQKIKGISGATILGNGKVSLIIDVSGIVSTSTQEAQISHIINKQSLGVMPKKQMILEPGKALQILTFLLGEQLYGINVLEILQLKVWEDILPLPNTPSYIKGVINLQGIILPVIDLHERFDLDKTEADSVIITLNIAYGDKTKIVGIIVDKINEIYTIVQGDIKQVIENNKSTLDPYISGLVSTENNMIILLDIKKLFMFEAIEENQE